MRNGTNLVFVSAYQSSQSLEVNKANHDKATELLRREGVNFQVVKGVYKGSSELSFLLSTNGAVAHTTNMDTANNLALLFNQESILEVHNDRTAVLHYLNGKTVKLGHFTETDMDTALKSDSYTYEPVTNRYFVVR